jgi:hypothetical protein
LLIDPHVNPNHTSPQELLTLLQESALTGVVLAMKHEVKACLPYIKLLHDHDFIVFQGVELQLEHGSLVFIPEQVDQQFIQFNFQPKGNHWHIKDLFAHIKGLKGVLIATHPYSRLSTSALGDVLFTLPRLDAVETRIAKGQPIRDLLCDEAAKFRKLARIGSSSGDLKRLGQAVTAFSDQISTQSDLVQAIKEQLCWPIEFENVAYPRDRYQG